MLHLLPGNSREEFHATINYGQEEMRLQLWSRRSKPAFVIPIEARSCKPYQGLWPGTLHFIMLLISQCSEVLMHIRAKPSLEYHVGSSTGCRT